MQEQPNGSGLDPVYNPRRRLAPVSERPWHILGAGAIGSLFAQALAHAGAPCVLLTRRPGETHRDIQILQGDERPLRMSLPCERPDASTPISQLLVTTKAYDVADALGAVAHRTGPGTAIVLLTNGMGLAEIASRLCPDASLYCATTTEGAFRLEGDTICHAGHGTTRLGSLGGGSAPAWFSRWQRLALDCCWEPEIEAALWHKLAINCAINPLTALHGCRNGELARNPDLHRELARLCDEIAAVSLALGFDRTAREIHDAAREVSLATASNRSSMLQDLSAGRETEIEYITGYLVRRAGEQGIPVPCNRALLDTIRRR